MARRQRLTGSMTIRSCGRVRHERFGRRVSVLAGVDGRHRILVRSGGGRLDRFSASGSDALKSPELAQHCAARRHCGGRLVWRMGRRPHRVADRILRHRRGWRRICARVMGRASVDSTAERGTADPFRKSNGCFSRVGNYGPPVPGYPRWDTPAGIVLNRSRRSTAVARSWLSESPPRTGRPGNDSKNPELQRSTSRQGAIISILAEGWVPAVRDYFVRHALVVDVYCTIYNILPYTI